MWNGNNFEDLFRECYPTFNYEKLEKNQTYSFIIKHKKNRIISPIIKNMVILIEVRDTDSLKKIDLENIDIDCEKVQNIIYNNVKENILNDGLFYGIKGYTFYYENKRYKIINKHYKHVKDLKPNTNNLIHTYLIIKKNNNLREYLKYFSENKEDFEKYRKLLYSYTRKLYEYYNLVFIKKKLDKKDLPYEFKTVIYDLHKIYINEKKYINWKVVKDFVNRSNTKLICSNLCLFLKST